jgi:hypothetical protein
LSSLLILDFRFDLPGFKYVVKPIRTLFINVSAKTLETGPVTRGISTLGNNIVAGRSVFLGFFAGGCVLPSTISLCSIAADLPWAKEKEQDTERPC